MASQTSNLSTGEVKFVKRCAIYARVSTDERLDQEFNSIDAQIEACRAFIQSQKSEGWEECQSPFIDPGFSGGNTNRPALMKLLGRVNARSIDMIVVYKIDRLSRSLSDFSKMIESLEAHDVSFSSVTQQINSSTSMGRLMLNVLLSFAQFEREVTAERIRDKIGAAKRKGMWMGGVPPLGYDVMKRQLIINPDEAKLVRRIFEEYKHSGSVTTLCASLASEGVTSKSWMKQDGKFRAGKSFTKKHLYDILRNRIYLGEISLKDEWFQGQHEPIIDTATWEHVQSINAISWLSRRRATRLANPSKRKSLLRGILFDTHGDPMYPSVTTSKSGISRLYYVSSPYARFGAATRPSKHYPGDELEQPVIDHIKCALKDPALIQCVINEARTQFPDVDEASVVSSFAILQSSWEMLHFQEQYRLVQLLIKRVDLVEQEEVFGIEVEWHEIGWLELLREYGNQQYLDEQIESHEIEAVS